MFLSEKQVEAKKIIDDLKMQVELLDSHKTVGLITDKQYAESLYNIYKKVEVLEKEYGIKEEPLKAFNVMFHDSNEKLDEMMEMFHD